MNEKIINLENGVILHLINTEKFKTNLIATFLITELKKDFITMNSLIPAVLKRGTKNLSSMKEISNKMDDMYGAIFDASSDKIGDNQVMQFYISTIDDAYALNNEKLLLESIDFMHELIFEPKLVLDKFDEEYVASEKEQLRELIKGKINDKAAYSVYRCTEEMFLDDAYGVYKYGREEDLENINAENLYNQYKKVIDESEIHIYLVGKFEENEITEYIKNKFKLNRELFKSQRRKVISLVENNCDVKDVVEHADVIQGKLVLGYEAYVNPTSDDYYKIMVYNAILGSSANSKLFQNVREKASLAYTVRSTYIKHKAIMMIMAGIEMDKHEKALELILKEVSDMNDGNFSDDDIKNAKIFLVNIYKSYTDDSTTLVDLSMGQYLLDMNFNIDEIIAKIENVTREDITEVANKMKLKVNYFLGN